MSFDLQLDGLRALVTGGTKGVGAAVVQALHGAGGVGGAPGFSACAAAARTPAVRTRPR